VRIAYFVHDLSDPAVARRVRMLQAGGAQVSVLGFRRSDTGPPLDGAEVVELGRTYDARFAQRIGQVAATIARSGALRPALAGADVVLARNLEMLAVATAARRRHASRAGLVYECLDVHRLMLGGGAGGAGLRALERWLMKSAQLLVVSSPAFVERYFAPRQGLGRRGPPVLLVENKVLDLSGAPPPNRSGRPPGPPWRIGWYGAIRCRRSLDLLGRLAARRPDLVQVVIRGRPALTAFEDFDAQVAAGGPALGFAGPYTAQDLARLYRDVHFTWAIDWFEAGTNSDWLLPNRIYEGGRFGAVPLALSGVETGRWLATRGVGLLMDDPEAELEGLLETMTPARYRTLESAAAAVPAETFAAGLEDCRELVRRLAETGQPSPRAQRKASLGVEVEGTKFKRVGGGIPCSDS
jgi:succinoglycan biosynthesis protein ExoL